MNQKKKRSEIIVSVICIIVCLLTTVMVRKLFAIAPGCAYDSLVHETTGVNYVLADPNQCKYSVDTADFKGDYYNLLYISGWAVGKKDGQYKKDATGIILRSNKHQYEISTYAQKRTDVYYTSQSVDKPGDVNVGFFAYVPEESIEQGKYNIGIVMGNGKDKKVLWSDRTVKVEPAKNS